MIRKHAYRHIVPPAESQRWTAQTEGFLPLTLLLNTGDGGNCVLRWTRREFCIDLLRLTAEKEIPFSSILLF